MALQEIQLNDRNHISARAAEPPIDFYRAITKFTEGLTEAQLQLLRDHLERLFDAQQNTKQKHQTILSKRETEVLILLTNGYSRRDIGHSLGISANTSARHIANIYQKLGISCVAEATHYALSRHIIG